VIFRCGSSSSSSLNRDETGDSRRSRSVHLTVNPFNMKLFLPHLCLALLGSSEAHEYYDGSCPDFPPVGSLDWSRWSSGGAWQAAFKHNSRSSCIRYEFSGDGEKRRVDETKLLPVLGRFGVPSAVKSSGTLTPASSNSGAFSVKWETGVLRQAFFSPMEYVVLATDYTSKALVCSCQDLSVGGLGGLNRRSCDFLVRGNESAPVVLPSEFISILDKVDADLALDMKRVRQDNCEDLDGLSFNLGKWVQAGKAAVDSGLAYLIGLF